MAKLNGSFSGVVTALDEEAAQVRLEKLHMWDADVKTPAALDNTVTVLRRDFMQQMPMPSLGSYVEGRLEHDSETGQNQFLNLVRPV